MTRFCCIDECCVCENSSPKPNQEAEYKKGRSCRPEQNAQYRMSVAASGNRQQGENASHCDGKRHSFLPHLLRSAGSPFVRSMPTEPTAAIRSHLPVDSPAVSKLAKKVAFPYQYSQGAGTR